MATWIFEPGHTAAEFRVRHMMVTWVRGHIKRVEGNLDFDLQSLTLSSIEASLPADTLWTGEPQRDTHLKSADFLDVAGHPQISFRSSAIERTGAADYRVKGDLHLRGIVRPVVLEMSYLGTWRTPYNEARVHRVGFKGKTMIDRHPFGVSWNASMEHDGKVVGDEVFISLDVEGILETDLRPILARQGS
jgi:polyisoprenoid-binding protein YceI